jgi:nucleoside-diphosphate-sugar epimerase
MSSIKAMGEETSPSKPFRALDVPRPQDAYGRGKLATEQALTAVAGKSGIELVILRPPLVYGPGVRANFAALVRLATSGMPLPFAAIDNKRSLIFIDNLVDLAVTAAWHPAAAGGIWLIRDTIDLSTPALVRALAAGVNRPCRLFALPQAAWSLLRTIPGLGSRLAPLLGSLQVDDGATRTALEWLPPVPAASGLALTARSFMSRATSDEPGEHPQRWSP